MLSSRGRWQRNVQALSVARPVPESPFVFRIHVHVVSESCMEFLVLHAGRAVMDFAFGVSKLHKRGMHVGVGRPSYGSQNGGKFIERRASPEGPGTLS